VPSVGCATAAPKLGDAISRQDASAGDVRCRPGTPRAGHLVREAPGDAARGSALPRGTGARTVAWTIPKVKSCSFPRMHVADAPRVLGEWLAPDVSGGDAPHRPAGRSQTANNCSGRPPPAATRPLGTGRDWAARPRTREYPLVGTIWAARPRSSGDRASVS
jgi:hypothetical protein